MLNERQEIFCELYILYGNATKAYKGAGYETDHPGQAAHVLLKDPAVQQYMKERRAAIRKDRDLSRDRIIEEYSRIAFATPKDLFDDEDKMRPLSDITMDAAAAISGIKFGAEKDVDGKMHVYIEDIKTHSKIDALKELSKLMGYSLPEDPLKNKVVLQIDQIEIVHSSPGATSEKPLSDPDPSPELKPKSDAPTP